MIEDDQVITQEELERIRRFFNEDLGLCDCGNPEDAYELVRRLLELAPFHQDEGWRKVPEVVGGEGAAHMVLSMLERAGLIEHGGTIMGSWLTSKGVEIRDVLRKVTSWEALDSWPEW